VAVWQPSMQKDGFLPMVMFKTVKTKIALSTGALSLFLNFLNALETKGPWFLQLGECELATGYTLGYYPKVNGATSHHTHSPDETIAARVTLSPLQKWEGQIEMEWADTAALSWSTRSAALALRTLWLDDVAGDPVSTATEVSFRYMPSRCLRDPAAPYQGSDNFSISQSIGKEWSVGSYFTNRTFGKIEIGDACQARPWTTLTWIFESNWEDRHRILIGGQGYIEFGRKKTIELSHFHGYGNIAHRSIDLQIAYSYFFGIWGNLQIGLEYRILAIRFPEKRIGATLNYDLPFSPF